ncbi:hypothetical protein ALC56_11169 [Trachymyrmex septentrionalis]|uniref:Uncharacterized protein n=1 Tax=Trachymyrmex septentrionalis TaxID=34720 RepID=A0A195F278_9HYME|nr:hypothetical protein ALC56_11169 [Trachymyrmex septentrionalis]
MDPWGVSLPLTRPEANWPESRVAFPSSGSGIMADLHSDTEGVRSFKKSEKGGVYDEWTDGTPPPPPPPQSPSGGGRWRKGKKKCSVQTRQRLSPTEAAQIGGNAKRLPRSGNARQRNRKKGRRIPGERVFSREERVTPLQCSAAAAAAAAARELLFPTGAPPTAGWLAQVGTCLKRCTLSQYPSQYLTSRYGNTSKHNEPEEGIIGMRCLPTVSPVFAIQPHIPHLETSRAADPIRSDSSDLKNAVLSLSLSFFSLFHYAEIRARGFKLFPKYRYLACRTRLAR